MFTENFKVSYKHGEYETNPEIPKVNSARSFTECTISDTSGEVVAQGVAKCYYKDVPNRRVGRRESFRKAVESIPSKEQRTELWKSFIQTNKKCLNC